MKSNKRLIKSLVIFVRELQNLLILHANLNELEVELKIFLSYTTRMVGLKSINFHDHFYQVNKSIFWGVGSFVLVSTYGIDIQGFKTLNSKSYISIIKFSFSEKATKISAILLMVLTFSVLSKRQNHKEDGANFFGLLRKAELYQMYCSN